MRPQLQALIHALADGHVRFVIVGGVAINLRGYARATDDFDLAYARDRENISAITKALLPLRPRLRGADPSLPFFWDAATVRQGCNFTLDTDAGPVDLLGEVTGLGAYDKVEAVADPMRLFERDVMVLTVDGLLIAKRAAGRPKDLLDLGFIAALKK